MDQEDDILLACCKQPAHSNLHCKRAQNMMSCSLPVLTHVTAYIFPSRSPFYSHRSPGSSWRVQTRPTLVACRKHCQHCQYYQAPGQSSIP